MIELGFAYINTQNRVRGDRQTVTDNIGITDSDKSTVIAYGLNTVCD